MTDPFEIFLITYPGLEDHLAQEARELGLNVAGTIPGGVTVMGHWRDVWSANLNLRGATRVLARIASFRAMHLAQLDKRSHKLTWADFIRAQDRFAVDVSCRKSRIYHDRAAAQRIATAITNTTDAIHDPKAFLRIKARIEDDLCTVSIDTSREPLHKRGYKQAVNKAPMRETLAALLLRACGYSGTEPVFDPMCGSGTIITEAAQIAMGLQAGRARDFAFQNFGNFDAEAYAKLLQCPVQTEQRFFGSDRDQGAIGMSVKNATSAGVTDITQFTCAPISEAKAPTTSAGLVMINPPYGGRIGNKSMLYGLYASLGKTLKTFAGWRVGFVTSEPSLAKATGLHLTQGSFINHGGIKIRLYQAQL